MSYMFLSFSEHLNQPSKQKGDFYTSSLNEQYENLLKRIPEKKREKSFNNFIEGLFPTNLLQEYTFSCPNFLRELHENNNGKTYLNNVVIRPPITLRTKKLLPDGQNIILIGDISETDKYKMFEVKGIEFIDETMNSNKDIKIKTMAVSSYGHNTTINGTKYKQWSIDRVNHDETLFTPDFVNCLIKECFTVEDVNKVIKTYKNWKKYFEFRDYYLDEQSKRNLKLDSVDYIDSYAINRKEYKSNSDKYDKFILDERDEFKNGEMIVLSNKVENAEEFPLIKLIIDINKKLFLEKSIPKRGKLINEEEIKIRSLANDNVFITEIDPSSKSKYPNREIVDISEMIDKDKGYELGDKFKVISYEIEPVEHIKKLKNNYSNEIEKACQIIEDNYNKIINDELNEFINNENIKFQNEIKDKIESKKDLLDSTLDQEVVNNNDKDIHKKIDSLKNEIRIKIKSKTNKDKKESEYEFNQRINKKVDNEYSKIDIRNLYIEKNQKILNELESQLIKEKNKKLEQEKYRKNQELQNKYKEDIRDKKSIKQSELEEKLNTEIDKIIDEETIKRFALYFRVNEQNDKIKDKQKDIIENCKYLVYDNRAEKAKIERQKTALDNFYQGYVKNPYLSTYIFSPEILPPPPQLKIIKIGYGF